mgnify:CR=1 FL=1
MKNTLSEVRSILNGTNRMKTEEDQMTCIEDGIAKDTQSEWKNKQQTNKKPRL